jgi:hypothetical protein
MKQSLKMKLKIKNSILLMLCLMLTCLHISAQDSTKGSPAVLVSYNLENNRIPYLLVRTVLKKGKKSQPLPGQVVKLFIDSAIPENLVSKIYTDNRGKGKSILSSSLKEKWNSSPKHSFIAVLEATSAEEEVSAAVEITKAKIELDTAEDHAISVKVKYLQEGEWIPAADVEIKVGVERLASFLTAGEEETYTTDSTGAVTVQFNKDSIPGDQLGNIILAARVTDNDQFGNLLIEKTVKWGTPSIVNHNFFRQRTLWSTRFRTPIWLLCMASGIIAIVWVTILYLVWQLVRIKREAIPAP